MLPKFPQFKSLELSDKEDVEKITGKFPPYSDFNFVSMWSWDIKGEMRLSMLNENLVVRFTDYLTGEPFYSFLGDNKVNETVEELLEFSKKESLPLELKLIPEEVVKDLDQIKFKAIEDRNNFDYIYDVSRLAELKGSEYQSHRNSIHKFLRIYKNWKVEVVINFTEIYDKNQILSLFTQWIKNKGDSLLLEEYKNEFLSLNKLLSISDPSKLNLTCIFLCVDNKLVGFIINECVKKYNTIHFEKADTSFKGCYPFLMQQNSKILNNLNIKELNFEQDLGVNSLRFTKTQFNPSFFLKKYLITM